MRTRREQLSSYIGPADFISPTDSTEVPLNPSANVPREGLQRPFRINCDNRDEPLEDDTAGSDEWQGSALGVEVIC